ncbi:MAG: GntR family transcriptional regulator [Candidatus Thiodiazotropha sp.]|jgi:GntR family transcriptional regulator of vanillate catabolism
MVDGEQKLTDQVVLRMREMILRGELPGGQRVAEIPIAKQLGVSRTPIREALMLLAQEGLLEMAGRRGFRVVEFGAKEIEDAIDLRGILEGTAARLVAEAGPDNELLRTLDSCLVEGAGIVNKSDYGVDDDVRWAELNGRFHGAIVHACGNRALQAALTLNDKLPFASALAVLGSDTHSDVTERHWEQMRLAQSDHQQIVTALRKRQGMRVDALMREHARRALNSVELFGDAESN